MDDKLKELLKTTIDKTKPLAEAAEVSDSKFLIVLLGIYRISFTTLRDIEYISRYEETASSILDLTRKIIEHGISVEYMLMKGKEEMAERFQEYMIVQIHEEFELYRKTGQDPATISEEHKINVEENQKEFDALCKKVKDRKSWAGRSVEGMIEDLEKEAALGEFDISRLMHAYVWGCRLNHANPLVTHSQFDLERVRSANSFYLALGLSIAIAVHLRLTTRLIDESRLAAGSDIYPEITTEVGKIYEQLDSLPAEEA